MSLGLLRGADHRKTSKPTAAQDRSPRSLSIKRGRIPPAITRNIRDQQRKASYAQAGAISPQVCERGPLACAPGCCSRTGAHRSRIPPSPRTCQTLNRVKSLGEMAHSTERNDNKQSKCKVSTHILSSLPLRKQETIREFWERIRWPHFAVKVSLEPLQTLPAKMEV